LSGREFRRFQGAELLLWGTPKALWDLSQENWNAIFLASLDLKMTVEYMASAIAGGSGNRT
jgi:hypothetical protein